MAKILLWIYIMFYYIDELYGAEEPRVLILGAGMSGITAAKTLDDRGFKNFLVIEGSSRIGGRMKSVNISDHTVELGAMWIYGKGTNPIFKLVQDYGIATVDDYPETLTMRDRFGNNVTEEAMVQDEIIAAAMDKMTADAKEAREKNLSDFSIISSLRYHNWLPKTEIDDAIEAFHVDFEFGVPPSYLSAKHAHRWAPYEEFGSDEFPILNDTKGFQSMVEWLADSYMTDKNDRIIFNKVVKSINQNKNGVDIITADGSLYSGDYVIVTFSLGVFQHKEVKFSPSLPKCKQVAIDKFGLCPFTHVYLQFPSQFWDDAFYLLFASDQRSQYTSFANMNYIKPGSNILQLSVSGEEARRIERLDDDTIVKDIMKYIRAMYPNTTVPSPTNHAISRWTYDPLYHGAWSFWPATFTLNNMADMQAPYGRIFFAGEHLNPVQYGFVHGSYASGLNTTDAVIKCLENQSACPASAEQPFQCSTDNAITSCTEPCVGPSVQCNQDDTVPSCACNNWQNKQQGVLRLPPIVLVSIVYLFRLL